MKKIDDFDKKGALRILSSNDSFADFNENYTRLLNMHLSPTCVIQTPEPPNET